MVRLDVQKPKLPRTLAYALKTSVLEKHLALIDLPEDFVVDLKYWTPQVCGGVFEVFYRVPNSRLAYPWVYIRAGSIPREEVAAVRERMEPDVLLPFAAWLSDL